MCTAAVRRVFAAPYGMMSLVRTHLVFSAPSSASCNRTVPVAPSHGHTGIDLPGDALEGVG